MAAAANPPGFIRSYNPIKDADEVIQLIEESFNLKNDPESRSVINQMRFNAERLREGGWLFSPGSVHPGFVWVVDERIVGNISVIFFFEKLRQIALIANVAVQPEYQQMWFATLQTRHALRFIKQKRVSEVWLQVSSDNQTAQGLYAGLGFQSVRRLNNWIKEKRLSQGNWSNSLEMESLWMEPRRFSDWSTQKRWLEETYPCDTRWYSSVKFSLFSPLSFLNPLNWDEFDVLRHYALRQENSLLGLLRWQRGAISRSDNLWLALAKDEYEERNTRYLLSKFFDKEWSGRPLRVEYPEGRAEKAFENLGFRLARRLEWMKLK